MKNRVRVSSRRGKVKKMGETEGENNGVSERGAANGGASYHGRGGERGGRK